VKLDERKSSGPEDVIVKAVDFEVEMRSAEKVILDLTVWDIPGEKMKKQHISYCLLHLIIFLIYLFSSTEIVTNLKKYNL
jgi:hypothetical protein